MKRPQTSQNYFFLWWTNFHHRTIFFLWWTNFHHRTIFCFETHHWNIIGHPDSCVHVRTGRCCGTPSAVKRRGWDTLALHMASSILASDVLGSTCCKEDIRGELVEGHIARRAKATCHFNVWSHVIFLCFHVSFLSSPMCLSLDNPCIVCVLVHVSFLEYRMCHFRLLHVLLSGCSTYCFS